MQDLRVHLKRPYGIISSLFQRNVFRLLQTLQHNRNKFKSGVTDTPRWVQGLILISEPRTKWHRRTQGLLNTITNSCRVNVPTQKVFQWAPDLVNIWPLIVYGDWKGCEKMCETLSGCIGVAGQRLVVYISYLRKGLAEHNWTRHVRWSYQVDRAMHSKATDIPPHRSQREMNGLKSLQKDDQSMKAKLKASLMLQQWSNGRWRVEMNMRDKTQIDHRHAEMIHLNWICAEVQKNIDKLRVDRICS